MPNFTRLLTSANLAVLRLLLDRIPSSDRAWLARQTATDRSDRKTAALAEFSRLVSLAYANAQYDINLNGERWLLERLAPFSMRVLFDVGANRGDWCIAAFETNADAAIHAFEIIDETCHRLVERTAPFRSRILVNGCGLSDRNGSIAMYHAPQSDVHSSFLEDAHKLVGNTQYVAVERPVLAGDDYMKKNNIAKIDFLKIDVEGAESLVLDGFREALAGNRIDVIQFEYGKHNLITRVFLQDFYKRLSDGGFVLGKLYPDGVAFKPYSVAEEDFIGPNYIAVRAERRDIITAIAGR